MAVAVIEGEIETADQGRSPPFGNATIYKRIVWRMRDGRTHEMKQLVVDRALNPLLEPGAKGRFYSYTAIDNKGLFGVRVDGAEPLYIYPKGASVNAKIMLTIGGLLVITYLLLQNAVAGLGLLLLGYAIALLVTDRQNRVAGRALFDDSSAEGLPTVS